MIHSFHATTPQANQANKGKAMLMAIMGIPIKCVSIDRPSNTRHASRDRRPSAVRPQPSVLHRHARPYRHGGRLDERHRGMLARHPVGPACQRRKARE
jgi:hypothetical protein